MKNDLQKNIPDIDKLCEISHIYLTDDEKERIGCEIEAILRFASEAALTVTELEGDEHCIQRLALREDEARSMYTRDEMLAMAPKCDRGMPYVIRVVEGD